MPPVDLGAIEAAVNMGLRPLRGSMTLRLTAHEDSYTMSVGLLIETDPPAVLTAARVYIDPEVLMSAVSTRAQVDFVLQEAKYALQRLKEQQRRVDEAARFLPYTVPPVRTDRFAFAAPTKEAPKKKEPLPPEWGEEAP